MKTTSCLSQIARSHAKKVGCSLSQQRWKYFLFIRWHRNVDTSRLHVMIIACMTDVGRLIEYFLNCLSIIQRMNLSVQSRAR